MEKISRNLGDPFLLGLFIDIFEENIALWETDPKPSAFVSIILPGSILDHSGWLFF